MELTKEQEDIVSVCAKGHNCLITGQCGTGKTAVLRKIIQVLRGKPHGKAVAITGTTGMASLNHHGGTTIHHWAGLWDGRFSNSQIATAISNEDQYIEARTRIRSCQVLIIDEIGMLSCKLFEQVEYICRYVRDNGTVFGGLQVIVAGDFRQLAPVPNHLYEDGGEFCFKSPQFQEAFPHKYHLTKVLRQHEQELAVAVHELCEGEPSPRTEALMRQLGRPLPEGTNPIQLHGTRFDVDILNHIRLQEIEGQPKVYRSIDTGDLRKLSGCPAEKFVQLKVGSPVILIKNLHGSLCNGLRGVIKGIEDTGPVVDFGVSVCKIRPVSFHVCALGGKILAERKQIPLKLAFAITVHKAQGQTIPHLIVDCQNYFKPGQLGVAVGRATTTEGLQVCNYNAVAARLKHPPEVAAFYEMSSQALAGSVVGCCQKPVLLPTLKEPAIKCAVMKSASSQPESDTAREEDLSIPSDIPDFPHNIFVCLEAILPADQETEEQAELCRVGEYLSGESPRLRAFLALSFAKCKELKNKHAANDQKSAAWLQFMSAISAYLTCEEYHEIRRKLYQKADLTSAEKKVSARLVRHCVTLITQEQAVEIIKKQEDQAVQNISDADLVNSEQAAFRAKIRYLAGGCIHRIVQRLRRTTRNVLHSAKSQGLLKALYERIKILSTLRISEANIFGETKDLDSLKEINWKQGDTRGLCHVGDQVFEFFLAMQSVIAPLVTPDFFHLHLENMHSFLRNNVRNSSDLAQKWLQLYETGESLGEDEKWHSLRESCLMELYDLVTDHFVKIILADNLRMLKETLPKVKKMALRAKISAITKKTTSTQPQDLEEQASVESAGTSRASKHKQSSSADAATTSTESKRGKRGGKKSSSVSANPQEADEGDIYPCAICDEPCLDNPTRKSDCSIGCDSCQKWCHFSCVGLTGREKLKRTWYCPSCSESGTSRSARGGGSRKGRKSSK